MPFARTDPPARDERSPEESAQPPTDDAGLPASDIAGQHAELQRQGAKSAARGEPSASNPMFSPINRPMSTGESEQVWARRRDAWHQGHASQEYPPGPQPQSDGQRAPSQRQDEVLFGVTRVLTFLADRALTSASGFFFEREDRLFLVTSRHVLFDGPSKHAPDRIEIEVHTDAHDLTRLTTLSILLHRDGLTQWHQATDSGGEIDVATLEINPAEVPVGGVVRAFGPQHLAGGFERFEVGDRLAIPAFPLGFFDTVHHLPVVRQASVASSYGVRFQGLGYFLTDARMHRGCSGAPVLARVEPGAPELPHWYLLGVHSSRMDMASRDVKLDDSLGLNCAWYADVLLALTETHSARAS